MRRSRVCCAVAILVFGSPLIVQAQATQRWRTSWTDFLISVDSVRRSSPSVPQATFPMLISGAAVPDSVPVMRHFSGRVIWEGKLLRLVTKDSADASLAPGNEYKLDIEMPLIASDRGFNGKLSAKVHVYPGAGTVEQWRNYPAGSVVRFSAMVGGVAAVQPLAEMRSNNQAGYLIYLTGAAPTPE